MSSCEKLLHLGKMKTALRAFDMKNLAYFDCPTGISGDMCLGALVDAGVSLADLQHQLDCLGFSDEFVLRSHSTTRNGQAATRVQVELSAMPQSHRHLQDIEALILKAGLPERVTQRSLAIFRQLAQAEGAVHGIEPEDVHFHEVGAIDAIVDIVGTCIGLELLKIDELYCSSLPAGGGRVKAAHGWLPIPAPAVLKLLQMAHAPIYSNGIEKELVTPTGAAIATTLSTQFRQPSMVLKRLGLGAGGHDLPIPNILRLWIGHPIESQPSAVHTYRSDTDHGSPSTSSHSHSPTLPLPHSPTPSPLSPEPGLETVAVLETQVDDLSPQIIGYLYELLFAVGALDVFHQTVGMKKSRPGFLITVICAPEAISNCEQVLFAETTTLGIRRRLQERLALKRTVKAIDTVYGQVRIKFAYHPKTDKLLNAHPEYEDCATLAQKQQIPWQKVHQAALYAADLIDSLNKYP